MPLKQNMVQNISLDPGSSRRITEVWRSLGRKEVEAQGVGRNTTPEATEDEEGVIPHITSIEDEGVAISTSDGSSGGCGFSKTNAHSEDVGPWAEV
ncbi:unnamed protein product [Sphacelaria rigidula]